MPAKKKGAVKSAAIAAKEAELASEIDILRKEQDRERMRADEAELRRRIEEEEYKSLEAERVRQACVLANIREHERIMRYEVCERQLQAQVQAKEELLQEARIKLAAHVQVNKELEQEKESAMRRISMLNNELELSEMRTLEVQSRLESNTRQHEEELKRLKTQYEEMHEALGNLRGEHTLLQEEHAETKSKMETLEAEAREHARFIADQSNNSYNNMDGKAADNVDDNNNMITSRSALAPRNADTETAILVTVLQNEVEKYKAVATQLQMQLDRKVNDEEKSSLLIGILNTQLDSVREENTRLHTLAQKRLEELQAVEHSLCDEQNKYKTMCECRDHDASEAIVRQRQMQLEIEVHKRQVKELSDRLDSTQGELHKLEEEHKDYVKRAVEREQTDFTTNVSMKGELEKHKHDVLQLLKEKQTAMDDAFNYKLITRAEMDSLKARVEKYQELLEKKEREAHDTIRVLQDDLAILKSKHDQSTSVHESERKRMSEELEQVTCDRDRLASVHEALKQELEANTKDLYEKLVHMTACHDSKHEEVQRLRQQIHEKDQQYTESVIYLSAEKENAKTKINELEEAAEQRREEHLRHIAQISRELSELQVRIAREVQKHEEIIKAEQQRAEMAERNVARLQQRIAQMETEAKSSEFDNNSKIKALKSESRELRSELSIAKRTIDRLDGALGDQAGYKQLTEYNEKLIKEVECYKTQIAKLNSTVASMKMEEEVMIGAHTKHKMLEENDQLLQQLHFLQNDYKALLLLCHHMREALESSGATPATLRSEMTEFDKLHGSATHCSGKMSASTTATIINNNNNISNSKNNTTNSGSSSSSNYTTNETSKYDKNIKESENDRNDEDARVVDVTATLPASYYPCRPTLSQAAVAAAKRRAMYRAPVKPRAEDDDSCRVAEVEREAMLPIINAAR